MLPFRMFWPVEFRVCRQVMTKHTGHTIPSHNLYPTRSDLKDTDSAQIGLGPGEIVILIDFYST